MINEYLQKRKKGFSVVYGNVSLAEGEKRNQTCCPTASGQSPLALNDNTSSWPF